MSLAVRIEAERALRARDEGRGASHDAAVTAAALLAEAGTMAAPTPSDRGHRALLRAEHARLHGNDEEPAWRNAVDECRSMNEPFPLTYALLRQAEALSAAGAADAAATAASEALEIAATIGAVPLHDEIEALIRRARLRVDAPPEPDEDAPSPAEQLERFGLTTREREVLRLVADGRSNGEIAGELFISRKTASVHVSNILAKLGVTTRVQAAALAHRRGLARRVAPDG
jgi:DNA-binding CsgD family transcriptional regulator